MPEWAGFVVLFGFALLGNVPLGLLRRRSRRWTLPWWIGCDGSVPLLWALRHTLGLPSWAIVPEIVLALLGNIYGPRLLDRLRPSNITSTAEAVPERA